MKKIPETSAIRFLKAQSIPFETHPYDYEDRGGTRVSSEKLGVDEHLVVKTLVMEDESGEPLIVLMHGDCKVSTKALARQLGCKSISPCHPDAAQRHTGYQVGGTSPFGTRKRLRVMAERTIFDLPRIYINGGRRGLLVSISPSALESLAACPIECAISE